MKFVPVTIAILAGGLSACGGYRHEATEKYYLVATNTGAPYWKVAGAGLNQAAHGLGVAAEMVGPDGHDVQAEVQAFQDAVAKKPSGILVSAADPTILKNAIDSAMGQGIPVITIDSDSPSSKRLTFIGTNNYQAGLMGGRVLVDRLHGRGNVIVFTLPGQTNLDERLQGYKNVIADHPAVKIVRVVDVSGGATVAFDTTKQIIEGKSAPDAFVCLESLSCPEVADVLDRHKVDKVVVAMDSNGDTLSWIQKGKIAATIAQKPYTMAYFGTLVLDSLHHFKLPPLDANLVQDSHAPLPVFMDTGATLVDKSNVDAFIKAQNAPAGT